VSSDEQPLTIRRSTALTAGMISTMVFHLALAFCFVLVLIYIVPPLVEQRADERLGSPAATRALVAMCRACRRPWCAPALVVGAIIAVDVVAFRLLAARRMSWGFFILCFVLMPLVLGGGGLAFIVFKLFNALLLQVNVIGRGA